MRLGLVPGRLAKEPYQTILFTVGVQGRVHFSRMQKDPCLPTSLPTSLVSLVTELAPAGAREVRMSLII